jgi:hypothetical protein
MSIYRKARRKIQHFSITLQRGIRYVSRAIVHIFSPARDEYPKTGVQPFVGEPYDEKKSRHETL